MLDFNYVQPALSDEQQNCHTLKLAAHRSFLHRAETATEGEPATGLKSSVVLTFVREFFEILKGPTSLTQDPDFLAMEAELSGRLIVATR